MGLRCLLGHDFGEREVERDRREDGDEVVVAFRTVETCERCGERRLVSENKEIRPRERADAVPSANEPSERADPSGGANRSAGDDPRPDRHGESRSDAGGAVGSLVEAANGDDGTVIDGDDDASDDATPAETTDGTPTGTSGEAPTGTSDAGGVDPTGGETAGGGSNGTAVEEDDAVILTGDDDPTDGEATEADGDDDRADPPVDAGEDAADDRPDSNAEPAEREFGAWPEAAGEDEGFDASAHEDTDAGVEFGGGLTPTDDDHAAFVDAGPSSGTTAEDSNGTTFVRPEGGATAHDGETEYRCPNCGATESTGASSLRAGDICPECHKGYVAERASGEGGRNA
ncbi:MAG: hypothetical protein ABEJ61_04725 [Haloferacaceae archaeon]